MLRSMTAYGRAIVSTSLGRFVAEIQSINRKHLDIQTFFPRELQRYDQEVRKLINQAILRGQVVVKLFAKFEQKTPIAVVPNLLLARQLKTAWGEIAQDLNLPSSEITLDLLSQQSDIISFNEEAADEEQYRIAILEVTKSALNKLLEMRLREGNALQQDINNRLEKLQQNMQQISLRAPNATVRFQQKLRERLEEILPGAVENEERILREICVYAEKVDITEEVTRFNSHVAQCHDVLKGDGSHAGKTLEFLLQELGREINTIGSKSADIDITRLVIDIKGDLERIREQIQNIE